LGFIIGPVGIADDLEVLRPVAPVGGHILILMHLLTSYELDRVVEAVTGKECY